MASRTGDRATGVLCLTQAGGRVSGGGGAVVVAAAAAVSPPEDRVDRQWRRSEGKAVSSESDLTSLGETC